MFRSVVWAFLPSLLVAGCGALPTPGLRGPDEPAGGEPARYEGPVIDVHLHTYTDAQLTPPRMHPLTAPPPATQAAHMEAILAAMDAHGVVLGIASGAVASMDAWRARAPEGILLGIEFAEPGLAYGDTPITPARLASRHAAGVLHQIGEITATYAGLRADDPGFEPYYALAERLDVPVAIHTGISAPGIHRVAPGYRSYLGDPVTVEDVLVRHPDLRASLMHAGYPFLEQTLALLHMHPGLHVDLGAVSWIAPAPELERVVTRLVDAGYLERVMFGSDPMVWPDAIGLAVERMRGADYLSRAQKKAILYDNAARFFRVDPAGALPGPRP